ncbi:hypothetical protein ACOME3_005237 [Neoechinorhynchus agilis]
MKLNIAFPATGAQKLLEVDDWTRLRPFMDKKISQEVDAGSLGEEWKGYVLKITGGNDKQGFPMMQGVMTNQRVRLLLDKRHKCYRPRKDGERRRKSVRGCVVDMNLCVLACVIVKKGAAEIPGLTDRLVPRKLGPKRASKIRKLFNLTKEEDVRRYVIAKPLKPKEGRKEFKRFPKIQRLITSVRLQRKRAKRATRLKHRKAAITARNSYREKLSLLAKEERKRKESHRSDAGGSAAKKKKSESEAVVGKK